MFSILEGDKEEMDFEGHRQPMGRLNQPIHEFNSLYKHVLLCLISSGQTFFLIRFVDLFAWVIKLSHQKDPSGCSFISQSGFLLFYSSDKPSFPTSYCCYFLPLPMEMCLVRLKSNITGLRGYSALLTLSVIIATEIQCVE